ncbi:MAG: tRNA preQ1(34) S-adenosylmethionine ribosyltransferase-isomerase QueA [Candidatus Woesearchaeota archaeon]|nr:tRNA preQ1(34) S-adenosylmethionine ribosyltransferase-isomerase QueA [Candidatus Woesearchaeota archaeon]
MEKEERKWSLSDFDYEFPRELIAQKHAIPRDSSRLIVVKDKIEHSYFYNLADYINPGDVIVLNNTRVIPAKFFGKKATGGKAELLLIRLLGTGNWECLINGRNIKEDDILYFKGFSCTVLKRNEGKFIVNFSGPIEKLMESSGEMPLPHYIKEKLTDPEMYQTIYAKKKGAIASPTAGLHFTQELIERIRKKGAVFVELTLHVSLGTFKPVHNIETHIMDSEYYEINRESADTINNAFKSGKRIFAVGTTVLKTLETVSENGIVKPGSGGSQIFIKPGYKFNSPVSAIITNFHIPKSTLIMMIAAFGGYERIMAAYKEAIRDRYHLFSFGDSMLLFREGA